MSLPSATSSRGLQAYHIISMYGKKGIKELSEKGQIIEKAQDSLKDPYIEIENKTIGIILCKKKNDMLVEITLPENNEQIFASKY